MSRVWHQEVPEEFVLAAIAGATNPFDLHASYEQAHLVKQAPRPTRQLQRLSSRKVLQLEGQAQGRRVEPVLAGDDEACDSNAIGRKSDAPDGNALTRRLSFAYELVLGSLKLSC